MSGCWALRFWVMVRNFALLRFLRQLVRLEERAQGISALMALIRVMGFAWADAPAVRFSAIPRPAVSKPPCSIAYNPAMPDASPDFLLVAALDALLQRQPASRARLVRHVGKCVRLVLPLLPLSLRIESDGGFVAASADAAADVLLTPDPGALPGWIGGGRMADLFRVEGDGVLAADLAGALADFDWVLALRPYLGDIAASRVDQFLQGVVQWRLKAMESAGRNLAEYAVYEQNLLAEPLAAREFIGEVDRLREDVDRLEARLRLLEVGRHS